MRRLFIALVPEADTIYVSDPGQIHHVRTVLRLRAGEEVAVFDGDGHECVCLIERLNKDELVLSVKGRRTGSPRKLGLVVACAIPRKGGMDGIVDRLTQLGVDSIIPMVTARVAVRLDDQARGDRFERWQRLARAAAEQSRRDDVPVLQPVTRISDIISKSDSFDVKLIATLFGDTVSIAQALAGVAPQGVLAMIGPEGDFTPEEVRAAVGAGFIPVSLGRHVLRVETAAVAVAGYISLSLGL